MLLLKRKVIFDYKRITGKEKPFAVFTVQATGDIILDGVAIPQEPEIFKADESGRVEAELYTIEGSFIKYRGSLSNGRAYKFDLPPGDDVFLDDLLNIPLLPQDESSVALIESVLNNKITLHEAKTDPHSQYLFRSDAPDFDLMNSEIAQNSSDIDVLDAAIIEIENNIFDLNAEMNSGFNAVNNAIGTKVDRTIYDAAISSINDSLDSKLASSVYNTFLATKNQANGFAGLDANGYLDPAFIPPLRSHEFVVVANQTARLALTTSDVQPGDEAFQTDTGETYKLIASNPALTGSWQMIADTTPDWSAIANKPSFATIATTGSWNNLSNIPTPISTFAGLTPSNDDILQYKAGAWMNRTIAQLKTDLNLGATYAQLSGATFTGKVSVNSTNLADNGLTVAYNQNAGLSHIYLSTQHSANSARYFLAGTNASVAPGTNVFYITHAAQMFFDTTNFGEDALTITNTPSTGNAAINLKTLHASNTTRYFIKGTNASSANPIFYIDHSGGILAGSANFTGNTSATRLFAGTSTYANYTLNESLVAYHPTALQTCYHVGAGGYSRYNFRDGTNNKYSIGYNLTGSDTKWGLYSYDYNRWTIATDGARVTFGGDYSTTAVVEIRGTGTAQQIWSYSSGVQASLTVDNLGNAALAASGSYFSFNKRFRNTALTTYTDNAAALAAGLAAGDFYKKSDGTVMVTY